MPDDDDKENVVGKDVDVDKKEKQKRNQVLRTKFWQYRDAIKDAAPHIVDLFDNAHRDPNGKRETLSEVINNCFAKDEKNKWVLNLKNPYFNMTKDRYSYSKHKHGSLWEH